ncbi:cupin domain-containing protein [Luteolibacter marinus]|uniref:cupin domain-containing protein n=1 Tax=Luteolibacter marinus TaxID=2776705 RepID=UPI001866FEB4|nr:cupin domain-containing protein [Luteolibacter marinus]
MNPNATDCHFVTPPEMKVLEAFGDRATFRLTGRETAGKYTAFLLETPPGSGPPPHVHEREDEWFHVLEGEVEFFANGTWSRVEAGSTVFAPRGSLHCFRNTGSTVLRQLIHTAPSGFEDFFAAMAAEWQAEGGPDMGRVVALSAEFGITYPEVDPAGT